MVMMMIMMIVMMMMMMMIIIIIIITVYNDFFLNFGIQILCCLKYWTVCVYL